MKQPKPDSQPQRILVMRYRFIGDTLLTVPFLRNLRTAYPDAQIDMLVGPNSGEVLTYCPYINELIYFDTTRKHRYENQTAKKKSFWHYVKLLRNRQYDTAFVLKRSLSSAFLAFLSGIPTRIGFNTEGRRFLLTHPVSYQPDQPEIESFLDLLRAVHVPVSGTELESWWSPTEESKAATLITPYRTRKNILLHLTSSNSAKQWPDASAAQLAQWLLTNPERELHCVGAASDAPVYEALTKELPDALQPRLHNWCGQLSLLESMAFLKKMDGVIGVDSGTLHMAAAVGVPVIALFGPMDERKWQPPGSVAVTANVACRPCNLKVPCHYHYQCMSKISLEQVQHACETHWNS